MASWSRRRQALYWLCAIAIWVASLALSQALDARNPGAAAAIVAAGLIVFVVLFTVFVIRSLKDR
jgi:hypothetical protein